MKKSTLFSAAAAAVFAFGSTVATAATLDEVKANGELRCIVSTGLPGFAYTDANGVYQGFDADFCRATAAAVLGDASKVKFVPAIGKTRFTLLNSKEGDVIWRNTTWTFVRDVDVKTTFVGVNYYDGQGFMVPKALGVKPTQRTLPVLLLHVRSSIIRKTTSFCQKSSPKSRLVLWSVTATTSGAILSAGRTTRLWQLKSSALRKQTSWN